MRPARIADWWDMRRHHSEAILSASLGRWVEEHPGWFSVIAATYAESIAKFYFTVGSGTVDLLRLGEGVKKGGWGYAHDGLRVLAIGAPVLKGGRAVLGRVLKITDPGGMRCTWMAATKALRETGTRHFATLEDLMKAAGFSHLGSVDAVFVHKLIAPLKMLGATVKPLTTPSTLVDVIKAANRATGVVMFSVKWHTLKGFRGHTLLASRHGLSGVVFADRSGKIVKTLADLETLYEGISGATPYGSMAVVENSVLVKTIDTVAGTSITAMLALEVRSVFTPPPGARTKGRGGIPEALIFDPSRGRFGPLSP